MQHRLAWVGSILLCAAAAARAEEPPLPDGTVVQIEGDTVYFDLGLKRGVYPGMTLQVLRAITAKHPLTGQTLVDHFPLGTLAVEQAGRVLSYGWVDKRIAPMVKVGDGVAFLRQSARPSEPATREPAARAPVDAVGDELLRVYRTTLGKAPSERAKLLEQYLSTHPGSPNAQLIQGEIATFNGVAQALRDASAAGAVRARRPESEEHDATRLEILGQIPEHIYERDPLEFAIHVTHAERVATAFAYVRLPEEITYRAVPLGRDGDGYFRGAVPPQWVAPPTIEVFVEMVDTAGKRFSAATGTAPRSIAVEPLPTPPTPPGPGHSAIRGFFEFVDFNRFRGNDYYFVAEGDFTYRLGIWLWAVRTGFGVLYGRGGNVGDLDAATCDPSKSAPDPSALACGSEVGFNYGYLELEFHLHKYVGIVGRLLGGQTVQGNGIGGELRLRIGQETGTNLLLGGSFLKDIGALGLLQLEWNVIRGWPMSASVIVTNQPSEQNIGVRIVYQVAYRARSWLQPALRIGYDARNISHGGLSLGLGLIMAW
jgi:hypothetical protein